MEKRLTQVLQHAGVASRRKAEALIFEGKVRVNGRYVLVPQTIVNTLRDRVDVNGQPVNEEKKHYFLFHKPKHVLCSHVKYSKKTVLVIDYFAQISSRLFTAGRLDKESTGLMVVTNDGAFAHALMHPSFGITKEYLVKTREEVTDEHLKKMSAGIHIENTLVQPVEIRKVRNGTFKIVLQEGKKHEVRLLVAAANLNLLELKRIRIGPFNLDSLPVGAFRSLSRAEILSIK